MGDDRIYQFTVEDINGKDINMSKYQNLVLIIVNVASAAENTDRDYEQLQELYEKYQETGLRIIGFPCNQFGGQEPKSNAAIRVFAKKRGVTFDMAAKIDVNGDDTIPLYEFLKNHENTSGAGATPDVPGNFTKFLVDRYGVPRKRFYPEDEPNSMANDIESLISE